MKQLLLSLLFILFLSSCQEEKYGEFTEIKFEVISNDNLDFNYSKGELKITAAKPGTIKLMATNSHSVSINRIKLYQELIDYYDSRFSENHSVYEDDFIKISTTEYPNDPYSHDVIKNELTIMIKETKEKVSYSLDVSGSINMGSTIFINLAP